MLKISQALRLIHISWVLIKHGLDEVILATHLFRPVRFLQYLTPWYWLRRDMKPRGMRIRRALEELGPIFVKFGQILSTRRDLLPDDIADELAHLQDRVPPFSAEKSRKIIEKAYGRPISEVFLEFETEPFASASISQVHGAVTKDHQSVVVKVLRPNILKIIKRDVSLLKIIAELAERYWKDGKRLKPIEVVAEYEKTILDELDLIREGANASQLRRNFQDSAELYVPYVNWDLTQTNLLVIERIQGTPIGNIQELIDQNIDLKLLATRGVEIFFTQVFRDNFFHADMHPGNIFVSPEGTYLAVDFGIMGTLAQSDKLYLAGNFLAFFNRDYRRIAELHVESGWVPPTTRIDEFESAIRAVSEPIFERPLKEISFGHFLLRLFQTARRFDMEIQPQLVLLQKTLLNIEGLGRQLHPDLDLWTTAKPFMEKWADEQIGLRSFASKIGKGIPQWLQKLPDFPELAFDTLQKIQSGHLKVETQSQQLEQIQLELIKNRRKNAINILSGSLIISGSVIYALNSYTSMRFADIPLVSWIFVSVGALLFMRSLLE
ncbi:MAG: ubiquinone biosynthesis regulatory protein kinase UbiB [Methylococcales bacterium]|nr:ubiquinone biosynthesis regulatory protein kinase UbiB [Methylococcales bacterium]MBT7410483.1 ubiquinone biosynthesis regulatory protein kinase UbiB [Methylococcales bacterium]